MVLAVPEGMLKVLETESRAWGVVVPMPALPRNDLLLSRY